MKNRWYRVGIMALVGGLAHLAVTGYLYHRFGYYSEYGVTATEAVGVFLLGALAVGLFGYTRLVVPIIGLLALLGGAVNYEVFVTTPPEFPTAYFSNYVSYWYVWPSLLVTGGIAEIGLRSGYLGDSSQLRNVPTIPLQRQEIAFLSGGCGLAVALSLLLVGFHAGMYTAVHPFEAALGGFVIVTVALWGVLSHGLLLPLFLATMWLGFSVPEHLVGRGRASSLLVLLYFGVIVGVVALIEWSIRYRAFRLLGGRRFRENHTQ